MSVQATFLRSSERGDFIPEYARTTHDNNTTGSRNEMFPNRISYLGSLKYAPNTCFAKNRCNPSLRWPTRNAVLTNITNFLPKLEPSTDGEELETRSAEVLNPPKAAQPQLVQPVEQTNLITTPKSDEPGILEGEIPPRKRDRHTLLERAEACDQPPWAERPNIVSPELLTIQDHLWVAENADPRNFFLGKAVTPRAPRYG